MFQGLKRLKKMNPSERSAVRESAGWSEPTKDLIPAEAIQRQIKVTDQSDGKPSSGRLW